MALTVPQPASSFNDQFGWLFHNNNNCYLDASIYQDDDIMEFSDSSVEYPSYQLSQQQQVSV
jgi:hypothetical protein